MHFTTAPSDDRVDALLYAMVGVQSIPPSHAMSASTFEASQEWYRRRNSRSAFVRATSLRAELRELIGIGLYPAAVLDPFGAGTYSR